jgi:hypothetical protein
MIRVSLGSPLRPEHELRSAQTLLNTRILRITQVMRIVKL